MKTEVIETVRLQLEGLCREHAGRVVELRNEESVYRFFKNPHEITLDEHLQWFEKRYMQDKSRYDFVIRQKKDGNIIGTCGISELDIQKGTMEVSYLLDAAYQKAGYATEAVKALISIVVARWQIKEVRAIVHEENKASIHFIEGLGFQLSKREGYFKEFLLLIEETHVS